MKLGHRSAHAWQWRGSILERHCTDCKDWFAEDDFYMDYQQNHRRSKCKQCFMAAVVRRRQQLNNPMNALLQAMSGVRMRDAASTTLHGKTKVVGREPIGRSDPLTTFAGGR